MANKKTSAKSKKVLRDRTRLEKVLLGALLLIALLLLANYFQFWPYGSSNDDLGTAFYITRQYKADTSASGSVGASGSSGSSGAGASTSGGGSNSSGNGGSSGGSSSTKSPLLRFAAGVDNGDTKQETSGQAGGLNENCAIVVHASSAGKQEVCTYTEGDKVVTVTYLDDHVVSASRSGFQKVLFK